MKVTNPNPDRALLACINPTNSDNPADLEWFEIGPGESLDVDNYKVASTLVEYGATAVPAELSAARELWAEQNRTQNSRTASASASEGEIRSRQQATVDVSTGTADVAPLKGAGLDAAIREANSRGAGIPAGGSASDRREALARWQATRGTSTSLEASGRYVETADGELYLDDEGQPVELAVVETDEAGVAVFVDGKPVARTVVSGDETQAGPNAV